MNPFRLLRPRAGLYVALLAGCASSPPPAPRPAPAVPPLDATASAGTRVLVFTPISRFRSGDVEHVDSQSGLTVANAVRTLGERHGFAVEVTGDNSIFSDSSLARFRAVVLATNAINPLFAPHQAAFERFIRAGGGLVALDLAIQSEREWAWYHELIGADLRRIAGSLTRALHRADSTHLSVTGIPNPWVLHHTWWDFGLPRQGVRILLTQDEGQYPGDGPGFRFTPTGPPYPIAWSHEYDGGRAWFTGLGYRRELYSDPAFLNHLAGGILWAAGR